MKQLVVALIAFFAMVGGASAQVDQKQMRSDMIAPVVRVVVDNGGDDEASPKLTGSGVIVYSTQRNDRVLTFVLTNEHVVGPAADSMIGDPLAQLEKKKKNAEDDDDYVNINVDQFVYNTKGVLIATASKPAKLVAFDKKLDLAVLELADDVNMLPTAIVTKDDTISVFDKVFAVGSGMGQPTFATDGIISQTDTQINGHRYIQASAPIIMGNSGGALFRFEAASGHYELIGVPARTAMYGHGAVDQNIGWAIPAETVREFLKEVHLGFVVGEEPPATNFPGIEHP